MKIKLTLFLFLFITTIFAQNEISIDNSTEVLELDIDFIKSAIIGPKEDNTDTKVLRYKIKIPKHPTFEIEGNRFNNKTISALQQVSKNDIVLIFDIQTITIVEKKGFQFKVKREQKLKETKLKSNRTLNGKKTNLINSKLVGTIRGQYGNLKVSKKILEVAVVSCKNSTNNDKYSVDSFSIKFGYDQVFNINGNTLDNDVKEYLDYTRCAFK